MRVVLIPVKPLSAAKARLAPALDPDERRRLSLAMLADVIDAARSFDRVWVLNSDPDAASVARSAGVEPVDDPAPGMGLNASLNEATKQAVADGGSGILVVSADLAAVTTDDLDALSASPGAAIGPNRAGTGTNALWRSPGDAFELAFGPHSRAAHERLAADAELDLRIVERAGLAIDIDTPHDLAAAWAHGAGRHTRAALDAMGVAARLKLAG